MSDLYSVISLKHSTKSDIKAYYLNWKKMALKWTYQGGQKIIYMTDVKKVRWMDFHLVQCLQMQMFHKEQYLVHSCFLFILIINNLENQIRLFSDDISLFVTVDFDLNIPAISFTTDLNKIRLWSEQWLVSFHTSKTVNVNALCFWGQLTFIYSLFLVFYLSTFYSLC